MNNNAWFKKENPLLSLQSMSGGAAGSLMQGAADKTYVDDVYSTYVYKGNGVWGDDGTGSQTITNGIDNSEGGLLWTKARSAGESHTLFDTERASNKAIYTNLTSGQGTRDFNLNFLSNGFSWNTYDGMVNDSNQTYTNWNFRKAPGFFDIVTYTGTGASVLTLSHNLGCVPGMILIKRLDGASSDWIVYHRSTGITKYLELNTTDAAADDTGDYIWNDTAPTATHFTIGAGHDSVNSNTNNYIAYLFAGGESTAATATSCNFLGTSASGNYDNNKINVGTTTGTKTADLVYGTGDFTIEAWVKCESSSNIYRRVFNHGQEWGNGTHVSLSWDSQGGSGYQNKFSFWSYNLTSSEPLVASATHTFDDDGQWHHVAVSRQSGTFRIFVDGILEGTNSSYSGSTESVSTNYLTIGATHNANVQECFKGNISNVRIVKGTAVYTSSFRPPTEPLTNITNTKLLCCNGSSVTSATVTPITLTVGDSSVTASTDSPFDDPEGFKFGEDGDQNIIKTGKYIGNGSSTAVDINIGWEPQWLLIKCSDLSSENWFILDSMRGIVDGAAESTLSPNVNTSEASINAIDLTPTGFKTQTADDKFNGDGHEYIYMAIRRPDGYVAKPAEAGTDVFTMDVGNGSSTIPSHDSGFPVDFAFVKQPAGTGDWDTSARLIQEKFVDTNTSDAEQTSTGYTFDSNVGWGSASWLDSAVQSWMWKRGQGMDVVAYTGDGVDNRNISHSMNQAPEMIWIKNMTTSGNTGDWMVGHKDLNAGSSPWNYYLVLNKMQQEYSDSNPFNNSAPTSTSFQLDSWDRVNASGSNYIAMLFSSVTGISKVGSYTGTDSNPGPTITTGFQPRFIMIKARNQSGNWVVLDSLRGISNSGNDHYNWLNLTNAQESSLDLVDVSSTGFTIKAAYTDTNVYQYIYYAHA